MKHQVTLGPLPPPHLHGGSSLRLPMLPYSSSVHVPPLHLPPFLSDTDSLRGSWVRDKVGINYGAAHSNEASVSEFTAL